VRHRIAELQTVFGATFHYDQDFWVFPAAALQHQQFQLVEHLARQMNFTLQLVDIPLLRPNAYRLAEGAKEGPVDTVSSQD